jgi:hypothetical protein
MIIEIQSLGISQPIDEYTLVKELDANKIKRSLNTDVKFQGTDYELLLEQTISGKGIDDATATEICGVDEVAIQCNIMHNEGIVYHRSCQYSKKVFIKDAFTCIKDLEVNIFDYPAKSINTIQGTKLIYRYFKKILKYISSETKPDLNEILSEMGGIPAPDTAYIVSDVVLIVVPKTVEINNNQFGLYNEYAGHECILTVTYMRIQSAVQHSDKWIPIPGSPGLYYYTGIPEPQWKTPLFEVIQTDQINEPEPGIFSKDVVFYISALFQKGTVYPERDISNCISFNAIIEGIFQCVGIEVVSNFFGINSDSSHPNNEFYQYALANLQNIYVAQSYDIIRESAIQDSFGVSGKIKAKKWIDSIMSLFNLLLIVDTVANKIRLEHVSYFSTKGIDFTTNGKDYGLNDEIEVNKELIGSEKWRYAVITPNGYETLIKYDVLGDAIDKETPIEQIIVDVFGTINNKDYEQDEYKKLFFLLHTDGSEIVDLNTQFYIENIIKKLHYINRPLPKGIHDGNDVSFSGYSLGLSSEIQFDSSIKDFVKFSPGNSIKINNGTWLITKMEYSKGLHKMGIKK